MRTTKYTKHTKGRMETSKQHTFLFVYFVCFVVLFNPLVFPARLGATTQLCQAF